MSATKHKKALVFFSAGVGDAILLVPLVNQLKTEGYHVTGLFTSPFHCESIFENTSLLDAIEVKKDKFSRALFSLLHFRSYDAVFVNHFAYSRSNLSVAALLGKAVYCNYRDFTPTQSSKAIYFIEPKADTHDALQNTFLHHASATLAGLNFNVSYKPQHTNAFQLSGKYIVLQISSANNKAPYKNWQIEKWLGLIQHLENRLPGMQLVVLGDESELPLTQKLETLNNKNVISLIGKTQLSDVMEIIYHSTCYIGLDSGLMHMAVALNKPTFTLWGASHPTLYGYDWLGQKHKVVSLSLPCAPCSAWIGRNTSRVDNPLKCPDFKCIKELPLLEVKEQLHSFMEINKIC